MKFDKLCNSILERLYHGTPHDVVGSFDLNKIGSGEGAQAYGWGLYFAENPEVAKSYERAGESGIVIDGKSLAQRKRFQKLSDDSKANVELLLKYIIENKITKNDLFSYAANMRGDYLITYNLIRDAKKIEYASGNIYEVEINADKENDFLDWDKPLSEQSRNIFEILKENGFDVGFGLHKTGQSAYNGEVSRNAVSASKQDASRKASEFFKSIGIKGIKYLDQDSRGTGEGTYNYVVFDPSIIKIVAKNGEFVMNSKKPENVEI